MICNQRGTCEQDRHSGERSKNARTKPTANAFRPVRMLPNRSHDIPSKEWRQRRGRRFSEQIPELAIFLSIHRCGDLTSYQPQSCGEIPLNFRRFEETLKLPDARRMSHFSQSFRLDLPDALARDTELLTHFFQGPAIAIH